MKVKIYQTGPLEVNTYVLTDENSKEAVIIDLGGSYQKIKEDLSGYNIKFVLNTHGHLDHILGETELQKENPEIPIYMHKNDEIHINHMAQTAQMWGLDKISNVIKPDKFIDETSQLFIGKNQINIIHTPGHSKGSLSYYTDGKLFCGDALFFRNIGRTDFFDGDYDELIASIKEKLLILPDDTTVYTGHGPSTNIKDEKLYNPYLQ